MADQTTDSIWAAIKERVFRQAYTVARRLQIDIDVGSELNVKVVRWLNNLLDVASMGTPNDNDVPVWDAGSLSWKAKPISSGPLNFADNEVPAGTGTAWVLAHTPNPAASLLLLAPSYFVPGDVVLISGTDYVLVGAGITTSGPYGPGDLRAFYRY